MDKPQILKKALALWNKISPKIFVGGLQITDSSIQYILVKDEKVTNFGLRLPPGIIKLGKLQMPDKFLEVLKNLHELIAPGKPHEIIKAIVSLPAEIVYTQSFNVPNLGPDKIEEAVNLNLRIISPIAAEGAYTGSQILAEGEDHYDVLGAFVEKNLVEEMRSLLESAGFFPIIFEFPSLALSRLVNQAVGVQPQAILVLQISSDGLDIFIFRNGFLYFDYFRSWQSVQGENREISKDLFEKTIILEVQKVINFALSRFKETPKQALLLAPGLENQIKELLEKNFEMQTVSFQIPKYPVSQSLYVALGSAIRGISDRASDRSIVLGAGSSFDVFYEETVLIFIKHWRNVFAGVVGTFLLIFGVSNIFLGNQSEFLSKRLTFVKDQLPQVELLAFESRVKEFNGLVSRVKAAKETTVPFDQFLIDFNRLASQNRIILDQFELTNFSKPINLAARGPDHAAVIKFKGVLVENPKFKNVDLPLSKIIVLPDNSVSFNMSFEVSYP